MIAQIDRTNQCVLKYKQYDSDKSAVNIQFKFITNGHFSQLYFKLSR